MSNFLGFSGLTCLVVALTTLAGGMWAVLACALVLFAMAYAVHVNNVDEAIRKAVEKRIAEQRASKDEA